MNNTNDAMVILTECRPNSEASIELKRDTLPQRNTSGEKAAVDAVSSRRFLQEES
jgi:hypothetical protein